MNNFLPLLALFLGTAGFGSFGAKLEAVNASKAIELCGLKEAGLAVISVERGSLADEVGLREKDVLLSANGTKLISTKDFERLVLDREARIEIQYGRAGTRYTISRSPGPNAGALRVHYVGDQASETADLLRNNGFEVSTSLNVSADSLKSPVIVIENDLACKPGVAQQLEKRLKEGGGIVLLALVPWYLTGATDSNWFYFSTNKIAPWFGINAAGASYMEHGDEVVIGAKIPGIASAFGPGTQVFRSNGQRSVPRLPRDDFDEHSSRIALCEDNVHAFTHEYGKGRMYYQAIPHAPNYPKLGELLCAGVRWSGGR